jgi:lipopolysaccharide export system permease protein
MRILDRYLLRELLIPFGYCLGGFWVFWMAFDMFAEMGEFQRNGCTAMDLAQYYWLRTPEMLIMVIPIAFLLALLYALTDMGRHHELTAIRAAGVGLWRIALPYLAVGFLLSVTVFLVNELWVPDSGEAAADVKHKRKGDAQLALSRSWVRNLGFANIRHHRKWQIDAYNVDTGEMIGPFVEWTLATGTRVELLAERGWYLDGSWVFTNVNEKVYTSPGNNDLNITNYYRASFTNYYRATFTETPEEIESEIKINGISSTDLRDVNKAQLSVREILNYMHLHPELDDPGRVKDASYEQIALRATMLKTKLHARLATPWTCLVVVLIALPFGAAMGRRNVFVGVASSIVICFAYFILSQLAIAIGAHGSIPSWIAAWSPNIVFGLMGIGLTCRVR